MKFEHKPAVTEVVHMVIEEESFDFSVDRDTAERLRALIGAVSASSLGGELFDLFSQLHKVLENVYRVRNSPSREEGSTVSLKFERKVT